MANQWTIQRLFCAAAIAAALTWTAALERVHAASAPDLDIYFPLLEWDRDYLDTLPDASAGSGVVYWYAQDKYLVLDNTVSGGAARLLEYSFTHGHLRTISLMGFTDPEDIHLLYGNTFVIAQEFRNSGASKDELVVIDVPPTGTTLNISAAARRLQINNFTSFHNTGIESVVYINQYFYFTTEKATSSPSTWRMWRVHTNTGSGAISVAATDLFDVSALVSGRALDISGMATDGIDLWLLSDLGPTGGPIGRVLRVTTGGALLADYELPNFPVSPASQPWHQPEGIDVFRDPDTGFRNIVIMGEIGPSGNQGIGVEFMRFVIPSLKLAATSATDLWTFHPFLNGGGSQWHVSTTDSVNTSHLSNPAPQPVYQRMQVEGATLTWTANNLTPSATYKVRVHLSSINFPWYSQVRETLTVTDANNTYSIANITPYLSGGFNQGMIVEFSQNFTPTGGGQISGSMIPTGGYYVYAVVSAVELVKNP